LVNLQLVNRRKSSKPAQQNQWSHEALPHRYIYNMDEKEDVWTINIVDQRVSPACFYAGSCEWTRGRPQ